MTYSDYCYLYKRIHKHCDVLPCWIERAYIRSNENGKIDEKQLFLELFEIYMEYKKLGEFAAADRMYDFVQEINKIITEKN